MQFYYLFAAILVCSALYYCKSEELCANVDEDGTCLELCSEDMFVYMSSCDNEAMSQRTCREPVPRSLGRICDFSRCECNDPKLWDEAASKCVMVEDCSDQSKVTEEEEKLKRDLENTTYSVIDFEMEMSK